MQDTNGNGAVFTMVWGTDINVTDVQRQFTSFVKQFRVQTGEDAEGVPQLADEAKYMAYLKEVRNHQATLNRILQIPSTLPCDEVAVLTKCAGSCQATVAQQDNWQCNSYKCIWRL